MLRNILLFSTLVLAITSCVEETDPTNAREDFLGNWTCNEYEGDFAPQTYNVEVTALGNANGVQIYGLYNQGPAFVLTGSVSGNTLYIDNQTVSSMTISGFGTINDNLDRVDVTFSANDGSFTDNVKATWLR